MAVPMALAVLIIGLSIGMVYLICPDCGVPPNQVNGRCE